MSAVRSLTYVVLDPLVLKLAVSVVLLSANRDVVLLGASVGPGREDMVALRRRRRDRLRRTDDAGDGKRRRAARSSIDELKSRLGTVLKVTCDV